MSEEGWGGGFMSGVEELKYDRGASTGILLQRRYSVTQYYVRMDESGWKRDRRWW